MSQKNYNLEIVKSLLLKENHVRGLAKDIGTNQTTIARKLQELSKENAVDFRIQGKNKIAFLKQTFEAKQYCCIMEQHKTLETIGKYPLLRAIFERIRKNPKVTLALLFGSYAKGNATEQSDIDIYIKTKNINIKKEVELIHSSINVKIGPYNQKSILIKEIEKNHIVIKGTEEYYEKSSFFT